MSATKERLREREVWWRNRKRERQQGIFVGQAHVLGSGNINGTHTTGKGLAKSVTMKPWVTSRLPSR